MSSLSLTNYLLKHRHVCFDLEFSFFHISIGFNGTDVAKQSDYPILVSSTAITSVRCITSGLEAHRFNQMGTLDAADVGCSRYWSEFHV